ncbi:MAG: hypothetical protein A2312_02325 [Candidatus Staskawiczbacteria bacterium RIFOXYB2_FULL_32_9]|uniref:Transposase IS200-like domain-containing protein n=1 Tax=Candidatus Staskawiczbacteria bacterium RIFOXYD1_FULL_32_13 TaxID=1802234 RepID=A0A1G2JR58_9BACT|nr:MAG: hypothetical protein A2360_04625 [Candidatus Staskawiczbacteria bacterium RIFOXYB1_FULL_32_11]OGZ83908.1 MAG: hypothetical protein A2312_02325 [Candidatus Staskawiczbacteria bacterium RIFOXYB2_FULL_32_9]OGZ87859.1 MAG: hypothetical protein A2463_04915 [Candidatus Staskawiczbacteria bacterium RIFOXYC2_FULL_32_10]OGZ88921.1 MAG: hypothetical protein A2561_00165 [Candidatus Staskawiczbacteria bacterium RIFOXYD1_FULL_32_13]
MPRRKEQFVTGEIYHLIIRALDNNLIFKDEKDYFRGIFSIYEFNNQNPVNISIRRRNRTVEKKREREKPIEVGLQSVLVNDKRDKFVEVLAFCFMPNHIHLLVKQIKDNGISKFMQKSGTGLSKYFNKKYQRKGHVFQDAFKSIHIENDSQLIAVFNYIHANPVSLIESGFKESGITDTEKVLKFLEEEFRWSSYFDYIGKENFKSVTEREFMLNLLRGSENCKNLMKDWVTYKKKLVNFEKLSLE